MITAKAEKHKKLPNNLARKILFLCFACSFLLMNGQNSFSLQPKKVGFLFNTTNENNYLFDDPDFNYSSKVYKVQLHYHLKKFWGLNFNLIVQPQFQSIQHQLLNKHFVTPDIEDYLEKRTRFTQQKTMHFYGFELGFALEKQLFKNLQVQANFGLGLGSINTETERLAKGFTFIENISLGINYDIDKIGLYFGTNIGHMSNLDFQLPNSGYNLLGYEFGINYALN